MRDIFKRISGQQADELEQKLTEKTAQYAEIKAKNTAAIETIRATNNARIEWLDRNLPQIEKKYLELCDIFDNSDIKAAYSAVFGADKDLLAAVIQIMVPAPNGKQTTFLDWSKTAFDQSERIGALKNSIAEISEKGVAGHIEMPAIEANKPIAPKVALPVRSFSGRLSGGYEASLKLRLAATEIQITNAPLEFETARKKINETFEKNVALRFEDVRKKLETVIIAKRLENALTGDMAANRAVLERGLAHLKNVGGAEEVAAWLGAPARGTETPRLVRLLEASAGDAAEQMANLETVFAFFPDRASCALFMQDVADDVTGQQAEALKAMTYALSGGDYAGTEKVIFAPAACGFIEPAEDGKIRLALHGKDVKIPLGGKTPERITQLLATRPGLENVDSNELSNPASITRSYYKKDENNDKGKLYTEYFTRSWHRPASEEEAHAVLDSRAAQDEDYLQLGDKTLIRKSAVSHAWQTTEQGKPVIKYVVGNSTYGIVNLTGQDSVRKYLDAFCEKGGLYLSATEVVKASAIGNAWIDEEKKDGTCRLKFIIGEKTYHADMGVSEAKENIRRLVEKLGHVKIHDGECINPAQCGVLYFVAAEKATKDKPAKPSKLGYIIAQRACASLLPAKQADKILKQIEKTYGLVRYGDRSLLNPAIAETVEYKNGKLRFYLYNQEWSSTMESQEAQHVMDALSKRGNFMQLGKGLYFNVDQLASAQLKVETLEVRLRSATATAKIGAEAGRDLLETLFDQGCRKAIGRELGIEINDADKPLAGLLVHYRDVFPALPVQEAAPVKDDLAPVKPVQPKKETKKPAEDQEQPKKGGINLDDFGKFNI